MPELPVPTRLDALSYIEDMLGGLAEMAEAHGELRLAVGLWMSAVEAAQARKSHSPPLKRG